jgi:hypothetical protein
VKNKRTSLLADALEVRRLSGKGFIQQAREIMRLKKRNPTLGAADYFAYRLYDPEFLGASPAENFLGWRFQTKLSHALNLRTLIMPAWDKFSFALVACAFDLPVPRLRAVYMPGPAATSGVADVALNSLDALGHWLRTQPDWPIFAKPSYGQRGYRRHRFTGYRASDDALVKRTGEAMPVEHFVNAVVNHPNSSSYVREMGYLFQDALSPHRDIAELLGNETISGVRVVLIQDEHGVEVISALWKLASDTTDGTTDGTDNGSNGVDNTRGESPGNLTGEIDIETGRLGKVLNGCWPHAEIVTRSPHTGRSFEGFIVPQWHEVVALCTRAAGVFPLLRIQYWDIAVTDTGPCILELNDVGSVASPQLWGRGLLTDRMRALLRDGAYGNAFSWLGAPTH